MANSLNTLSYASTNVTTSAYVTLVASTSVATSTLLVSDTSGALVKIAVGTAGHEEDLFQIPASVSTVIPLPSISKVPAGSRLSLKAISGTASTGFVAVTLLS